MSPQKRRALDDSAVADAFVFGNDVPPAAAPPPAPPPVATKKSSTKNKPADPLTTVNIKIPRSAQRWLQDTAQMVRDNNPEAVPPDQRVYPQHLIQAAIALLQAQDVDWGNVRNAEDLRDRLSL
jgi:hypothetical protein